MSRFLPINITTVALFLFVLGAGCSDKTSDIVAVSTAPNAGIKEYKSLATRPDDVPMYTGKILDSKGQKTEPIEESTKSAYYTMFNTTDPADSVILSLDQSFKSKGWHETYRLKDASTETVVYQNSAITAQLEVSTRAYADGTPTAVNVWRYSIPPGFIAYPQAHLLSFALTDDKKGVELAGYVSQNNKETVIKAYSDELVRNGWSVTADRDILSAKITLNGEPYSFLMGYRNQPLPDRFIWTISFVPKGTTN
ncbi:hypothetical protein HZC53_04090 [Candidatus Uhrbacteria bacterium]|nr:hypothetical protein [Candidatus Uhrbacteria bacterium]